METVVERQLSREKPEGSRASQDSDVQRRGSGVVNNGAIDTSTKGNEKSFAGAIKLRLSGMTNTLPKKDKKPVSTQGGLSNARTSKPAPHMSSISKTGPMNYDGDSIDDTSSSSITSLTPSPGALAARQAAYMDKHLSHINSKVAHGKSGTHIGMSTVSLDDTSSDDSTYSSQVI